MNRKVLAVALIAVLVVAAPVLGAVNTGSTHETASDFTNAAQLVGFDVKGSGDDGYIEYTDTYEDHTFDDEAADGGLPDGWSYYDGSNTGSVEVSTAESRSGSQSVHVTGSTNQGLLQVIPSTQPYSTAVTDDFEVSLHGGGDANTPQIRFYEGGNRIAIVGIQNGELNYYNGGWQVLDSGVDSNEWVDVEVYDWNTGANEVTVQWSTDDGDSGTQTVPTENNVNNGYDAAAVYSNQGDNGYADDYRIVDSNPVDPATYLSANHTLSGSVSGTVDITEARNVDADITWEGWDGSSWQTLGTTNGVTTTGEKTTDWQQTSYDKVRVNVTASPTGGDFNLKIGSESVQFESSDPEVTLNSPADGETIESRNVTLEASVSDDDFAANGDTVNVTFYEGDGTVIHEEDITSGQVVSTEIENPPKGTHDWYVRAEDSYGGATTTEVRSYTVERHAPIVYDNTMSPQGELTDASIDYTVDIDDEDFKDAGDTVNASLYFEDGGYAGSDELTANGTANVTVDVGFGGTNSYWWEVEDEYNHSVNSSTVEVKTPGTVDIRTATSPNSLIDDRNVSVIFYVESGDQEDEIIEREVQNGQVDMEGLPPDTEFIAVADADGYFGRRVHVQDMFNSDTIYLPNENETVVQPTFELTDYTGAFPDDATVLKVQRAIDNDWTTVEGDYLTAVNQYSTTLLFNERHRIILLNMETGRQVNLGSFTPTEDGRVTLEVTDAGGYIIEEYQPAWHIQPDADSLPSSENVSLNVSVDERDTEIANYDVEASVDGQTIDTVSVNDGSSTGMTLNLTDHAGEDLNVSVSWTEVGGDTGETSREYAISGAWSQPGLLDALQSIPVGGAGPFIGLFAVALMVGFVAPRVPPMATAGVAVIGIGATTFIMAWTPVPVFVIAAVAFVIVGASQVRT